MIRFIEVLLCVCLVQLKGDVSTRLLDVQSEVSRYATSSTTYILVSLSSTYFLSQIFHVTGTIIIHIP